MLTDLHNRLVPWLGHRMVDRHTVAIVLPRKLVVGTVTDLLSDHMGLHPLVRICFSASSVQFFASKQTYRIVRPSGAKV